MNADLSAERSTPAMSAAAMFRTFWIASTVSGVGTAVTIVALPLVALSTLHASAFQVSLLAAAGQAGWLLLGLPAGVIVQRYPLRSLQVAMDLSRAVAIFSIPLAWWLGHLTYLHLLVSALIVGLATVLFDIGNATFLPAIINKTELNSRNSLMSGTLAVTQTGGPSLGGLLIQVAGPVGALLVDAVSYLLSGLTLRTLPERRVESLSHVRATTLIRDGWNFVIGHPVMRPCMLWATATNFVCGALLALTPTYLVREAGVSAALVGLLIAADGVGSLLGSAIATRLASAVGTARALLVASLVGGMLALLMPLTTDLSNTYFFAIGNAGFAAGVVIGSIVTRTHRQTASPPELLSRVMATVRFVSWGAAPVGAAVSGVLVIAVGLRSGLWLVCAGGLLGPLILLLSPMRPRRQLSDVPDEG